MVQISEQFDVPSVSPRAVWHILSDPRAIVDCVPGATLGEEYENGTFDGSLTVKFGPAKVTFQANIFLVLDQFSLTGSVTAKGKDNQGGTRFRTALSFSVLEHVESLGARIIVEGESEISGKLARLIESGAKIVIKRMATAFAENLALRCVQMGA